MLRRYLVMLALAFVPLLVLPQIARAVDVFSNDKVCQDKNRVRQQSSVCQDKQVTSNPLTGSAGVLNAIINLTSIIVGILAVIVIILAGLKYITSGTKPEDVNNARERIIYALIALVIVAVAQFIVKFVLGRVI